MPETLGEKLRNAREEQDISISEVAEQTRISALYLEAIENDDFEKLPGGIFNKGFIKSFARYVGLDEHEALQDYASLVMDREEGGTGPQKLYKPEVMTDDSRGPSMITLVIFAAIVIGLLAWGAVILLNYLQGGTEASGSNGTDTVKETPRATPDTEAAVPVINGIKVELATSAEELSIRSVADGEVSTAVIGPSSGFTIEARESVRLSYYKGLAETIELKINGRRIKTPLPPEGYRKNGFEFEVNRENIGQILRDGAIREPDNGGESPSNAS